MFRCTCCLARRLCCLDVPSWKPWDWFWIAAVGWSSWMTPHGKMQLWVLTANTWSPSSMSTTATCGNFLLPLNSWSRPMVASVAISWTSEPSTKRPSSSTTSPMCNQQHRMDFVRSSAMCCRHAMSLSTPWRTSFTPMSQRSSINHLESDCSGKFTAVVRGCLHLQNQWAWTLRSSAMRLVGTSTLKSTRQPSWSASGRRCPMRSTWPQPVALGARCRTWMPRQKLNAMTSTWRDLITTTATWCLLPRSTWSRSNQQCPTCTHRAARASSQLAHNCLEGSSWTLDHLAPVHVWMRLPWQGWMVETGQEANWHSLQQDFDAGRPGHTMWWTTCSLSPWGLGTWTWPTHLFLGGLPTWPCSDDCSCPQCSWPCSALGPWLCCPWAEGGHRMPGQASDSAEDRGHPNSSAVAPQLGPPQTWGTCWAPSEQRG